MEGHPLSPSKPILEDAIRLDGVGDASRHERIRPSRTDSLTTERYPPMVRAATIDDPCMVPNCVCFWHCLRLTQRHDLVDGRLPSANTSLWHILRPSVANLNTICSALSPLLITIVGVLFVTSQSLPPGEEIDLATVAKMARRIINCSLAKS